MDKELADFYGTGASSVTPANPAVNAPAAPQVTTEASTLVPGSWEDMERRGIPIDAWPDDVKEKFIIDSADPNYVPPKIVVEGSPTPTESAATADTLARAVALMEKLEATITPQENVLTMDHLTAQLVATKVDGNVLDSLNILSRDIHKRNIEAGWWTDKDTGETLLGRDEHGRLRRNIGELLCLVHSEVSEAMEGIRKGLPDDKLPHRSMFEVELADTLIRIFDIAGAHDLDLSGAIAEKLAFNAVRPDHKIENRRKEGGKDF
jgi:NTP pyrophosphatase (non-canonical NTP hydrolase)